ncbi:hypothetical protein D3C78_1210910 [compost metagenome]
MHCINEALSGTGSSSINYVISRRWSDGTTSPTSCSPRSSETASVDTISNMLYRRYGGIYIRSHLGANYRTCGKIEYRICTGWVSCLHTARDKVCTPCLCIERQRDRVTSADPINRTGQVPCSRICPIQSGHSKGATNTIGSILNNNYRSSSGASIRPLGYWVLFRARQRVCPSLFNQQPLSSLSDRIIGKARLIDCSRLQQSIAAHVSSRGTTGEGDDVGEGFLYSVYVILLVSEVQRQISLLDRRC